MKLDVHPLTPGRWPDLETIFNGKGCSVARGCWCMYYRLSGTWALGSAHGDRAVERRSALKALVESGRSPGLLGYHGEVPVGWVSLGPREDYARLARSPIMKPVDEQPVWSIVCFVVPSPMRGQGVARGLLQGAIEHARRQGASLLEAYPVDRPGRASAESLWFGAKPMYDQAGFVEVARRKPQRPVVRLRLD